MHDKNYWKNAMNMGSMIGFSHNMMVMLERTVEIHVMHCKYKNSKTKVQELWYKFVEVEKEKYILVE